MSEQYRLMRREEQSTILVADDNRVNQQVMKLLLDGFGIPADFVSNGVMAVEANLRKDYDLILMDIQMPEMDGFTATRRIRECEFAKGARTPIIACTALDLESTKQQCLDAGVDDYLAKPISRQALREMLEHWMKLPLHKALERLMSEIQAAATGAPINRRRIRLLYDTDQIEEILSLFLVVTEASLEQLKTMINDRDVRSMWPLAHELKAASYAVSAEEMSALCQQMERAAKEEDWLEALKIYAALSRAFSRVKDFLSTKQES